MALLYPQVCEIRHCNHDNEVWLVSSHWQHRSQLSWQSLGVLVENNAPTDMIYIYIYMNLSRCWILHHRPLINKMETFVTEVEHGIACCTGWHVWVARSSTRTLSFMSVKTGVLGGAAWWQVHKISSALSFRVHWLRVGTDALVIAFHSVALPVLSRLNCCPRNESDARCRISF